MSHRRSFAVIGIVATACSAAASTGASAPEGWTVDGFLEGKVKRGLREGNVSGMACAPVEEEARVCLVIDDETQGAQVVVVKGDHLIPGSMLSLVTDTFEGDPVELDGEAAAYSDAFFYVIGSHGRPRHGKAAEEAKKARRFDVSSHLFRISLAAVDLATGKAAEGWTKTPSLPLAHFFPTGSELERMSGKPLKDGGMTIEGFAVRGANALVGFRGPVEGDKALILKVPLADLFPNANAVGGAQTVSRPPPGTQWRICLGKDSRGAVRGIRDLAVVGTTVYGIAGPVNDPPEDAIQGADYSIFRLPEKGDGEARTLADTSPEVKPEALVPLDSTGTKFDGMLLFDGVVNGGSRHEVIDFAAAPPGGAAVSTSCAKVGAQGRAKRPGG